MAKVSVFIGDTINMIVNKHNNTKFKSRVKTKLESKISNFGTTNQIFHKNTKRRIIISTYSSVTLLSESQVIPYASHRLVLSKFCHPVLICQLSPSVASYNSFNTSQSSIIFIFCINGTSVTISPVKIFCFFYYRD